MPDGRPALRAAVGRGAEVVAAVAAETAVGSLTRGCTSAYQPRRRNTAQEHEPIGYLYDPTFELAICSRRADRSMTEGEAESTGNRICGGRVGLTAPAKA